MVILLFCFWESNGAEGVNFTSGIQKARKFGVHEIVLKTGLAFDRPFEVNCSVIFTSPSGNPVKTNAFFDGEGIWKARVYVSETGIWSWKSDCSELKDIHNQHGKFTALNSGLKGMLRKDPLNPKAWITDNGEWFLNIDDTGYLLFNETEKRWKEYIRDLYLLGVTSVRAGALGGDAWDKNSQANRYQIKTYPFSREDNAPWEEGDKTKMNLERFKTTDERLIWMLNNYPDIFIQFILFGLNTSNSDDTGKLWKAIPGEIRKNTMKYMIARWSAFPQLFYLVVNDMHCTDQYPNNRAYIREVGKYFAANDPWHHLLSTGANRYQLFPFLGKEDEDWVSYIYVEDSESLDAKPNSLYANLPYHVFLGEDRYENYLRDEIKFILTNPEYYYRWMFWSWTLSGSSANYGGRWGRVHPYFSTDTLLYIEPFDTTRQTMYNEALKGLNSIKYILPFFEKRKISLNEFRPSAEIARDMNNKEENGYLKVMRKENDSFIIYHPNALKKGSNTLIDKENRVQIELNLTGADLKYSVEWYRPDNGKSISGGIKSGKTKILFTSPWRGTDVVLYLQSIR